MIIKKNLLIEFYTEELPPLCVEDFTKKLPQVVKEVFEGYNLEYEDIETYITPVRIIIYAKNVFEQTKKIVQEILGPSLNVALRNNEYTQAALGFAKKYNVELKDLYIKETEKGRFVAIKKFYGGENIKSIISKILFDILTKLSYPKQMVWEETKFKFPRPIRNILIIFGNEIIKTKLLSINSTNYTYGIKTYPLKKIKITSKKRLSLTESYFEILKDECIIFDSEERLDILKKMINNLLKNKKDLKSDNDENLLKEIISIVEYPSCVLCGFPEEFLALPKEFVIICMKTKQKFIPIYNEKGNLTNLFIGVKNGFSEFLDNVKKGYEKVLIARLDDVKYYYETDRKINFEDRFEKLKGIVYNTKLDSLYYDKVLRIKKLAEFLNEELKFYIEHKIINKTAQLIKNDLTTQIVYEYPELQGIAGKIYCIDYCKENNLPHEIALCCEEHYLPKNYEDKIPQNKLSILFSLSSKISDVIDIAITDNLPTGSSDPYGVKKTIDGIIKICKELRLNLDLRKIIKFYIESPITRTSLKNEQVVWNFSLSVDKIISFFSQRFENILLEEGYKIDETRTVLFNFNGEFNTKWLVISSLKNFRQKEEFVKLIELYKRIYNILQQARNKKYFVEGEINKDLLKVEEEKTLYEDAIRLYKDVNDFFIQQQFDKIINLFLNYKNTIDKFFDKVLVFDENKEVAINRLKILDFILKIFNKIGGFENIQL